MTNAKVIVMTTETPSGTRVKIKEVIAKVGSSK